MLSHLQPVLDAYAAELERNDTREDEDVNRAARIKAIRERIRRAFAAIRQAQMQDVLRQARSMATRFVHALEQINRAAMNDQFAVLTKIQVFGHDPEIDRVMHATIRSNAEIITSIPQTQVSRVEEVVTASVERGTRVEALRAQIQERFKVSESRAALIARTETSKFNATLAQTRQESLGITQYVWSCSKDERVRGRPDGVYADSTEDHWALEGTLQSYADPPIVDPVKGIRANPGQRYNCRCVARPSVSGALDALGL